MGKIIVWPDPVMNKLRSFHSIHFTQEESYSYIVEFIIETETFLKNPIVGKTYVEEHGKYKGYHRTVIRKFRVYYKEIDDKCVIFAVLFPGER